MHPQIHLQCDNSSLFMYNLLQVSLATFGSYVLAGNELTAGKAFVAISLFNILSYPMTTLPQIVTLIVQVSTESFTDIS